MSLRFHEIVTKVILRYMGCFIPLCGNNVSSYSTRWDNVAFCNQNGPCGSFQCKDGILIVQEFTVWRWNTLVSILSSQCDLLHLEDSIFIMMTSSNGNIFRVTGLCEGESTGHRWIPLAKGSDAELWCFHWSAPEKMVEQTIEMLVIWDTIALIMTSL